jgi:hypothetical protein
MLKGSGEVQLKGEPEPLKPAKLQMLDQSRNLVKYDKRKKKKRTLPDAISSSS